MSDERGTGFVAPDLAEIVTLTAALAPAPLVDEIVIDASAPGTPCVISLRCSDEEFGWHEVTGGLGAVFDHVSTLARDYGTQRIEVIGNHEAIGRFVVEPLRDRGLSVREVK